ncbi:hypothetical protein T4C_5263 [Trichinella pseudospiralis]|uniref:Uncharacterized protein n=1 Tax=Trichinella pseudospiralis TaxID=6337 RepID=A0A0V1GCP0_TRIPS|nr:hypothetical protein T4C_5263 [Trichinella pseudospiralis]
MNLTSCSSRSVINRNVLPIALQNPIVISNYF